MAVWSQSLDGRLLLLAWIHGLVSVAPGMPASCALLVLFFHIYQQTCIEFLVLPEVLSQDGIPFALGVISKLGVLVDNLVEIAADLQAIWPIAIIDPGQAVLCIIGSLAPPFLIAALVTLVHIKMDFLYSDFCAD